MTKTEFEQGQRVRSRLQFGLMVVLFIVLAGILRPAIGVLDPLIRAYGSYLHTRTKSPALAGAVSGLTCGLLLGGVISGMAVPFRWAVRAMQLKCPSCGKPLTCPGVTKTGRCCQCQGEVFTQEA